jgi:hypothetical protein
VTSKDEADVFLTDPESITAECGLPAIVFGDRIITDYRGNNNKEAPAL